MVEHSERVSPRQSTQLLALQLAIYAICSSGIATVTGLVAAYFLRHEWPVTQTWLVVTGALLVLAALGAAPAVRACTHHLEQSVDRSREAVRAEIQQSEQSAHAA